MSNLADLTKDIARDISDSDTVRNMKSKVNHWRGNDYTDYLWPAVGIIGAAVIIGYGIRYFLSTDQGQDLYRGVSDRLSGATRHMAGEDLTSSNSGAV